MEGNVKQDLWQFDVTVVKRGFFTVYAHDEAEARQMIEDMGLDKRLIHWQECEVESID